MARQLSDNSGAKKKAAARLYELLSLQKNVERQFGEQGYNIFVFGSYLTTRYVEGKSDIDTAIYSEDFDLYKRLSLYLEEFFKIKGIDSDIFYIDISMVSPIYCAPLKSQVCFTDYYPACLVDFERSCRQKSEKMKEKLAG